MIDENENAQDATDKSDESTPTVQKAAPKAPSRKKNMVSIPGMKGKFATKRIVLEENPDIPPTGLYVGYNGRGYLVRVGEEVDVPEPILEILDNAITSTPQIDPRTRRVVGYRNRSRYPYRVVG